MKRSAVESEDPESPKSQRTVVHFVSSCLVLSHFVSPCLALSRLVLLCLALSRFVLLCLTLSRRVLLCLRKSQSCAQNSERQMQNAIPCVSTMPLFFSAPLCPSTQCMCAARLTNAIPDKCSVCLNTFCRPCVLPCEHIICQECMMGLVEEGPDEAPENSRAKCPMCTRIFNRSAVTVSLLFTNIINARDGKQCKWKCQESYTRDNIREDHEKM
jgi:hypothetical protein